MGLGTHALRHRRQGRPGSIHKGCNIGGLIVYFVFRFYEIKYVCLVVAISDLFYNVDFKRGLYHLIIAYGYIF